MKEYIIRKCPKCCKEVRLEKHYLLPDVYEGYCENCGIWVKRRAYYCRNCGKYTLHEFIEVQKDKELWVCEECGSIKYIYCGLRRLPQRRMMGG